MSRLLTTVRRMAYNSDNVFRKILDGQLPAYKIFETETCIAILDAFPMTPGHSLLIPKENFTTIADMPADKAADFLKEVPRLSNIVKAATGCDGLNVFTNCGPAAGQVVPHVHIHVLPRFEGDKKLAFSPSGNMIQKEDAEGMLAKMKEASQ
eukprot:m.15646 g.15646  ORF g.15646 m.15646 type:complete len:152 (-) comp7890_c0_seq1:359-814(-)